MRFTVCQSALISRPGQPDIVCEIRDFCLGGLFLKFTQPEASIDTFKVLEGAEAEVSFRATLPTQSSGTLPPTFRLQVHLRRLSPLGVGVAFGRQPVEALRSLQKLRMAGHRLRLGAATVTPDNQGLRETCTTLLRESLLQTHDHLARVMEDQLSLAALHAIGIAEHSGLLNAPLEFKTHAKLVQAKWLTGVLEGLVPCKTSALKPPAHDEMALVDEVDFEDWLSTSSEVTRLEAHFKEQLADIEPRVSQLFAQAYDHLNNPFGPAVICHAYRSAIQDLSLLGKARTVAYAALREVLTEQLAPLYAELLAWLPVSEAEWGNHQVIVRGTQTDALNADSKTSTSPVNAATKQGALGRLTSSLMDFFRGQSAPLPQADANAGPISEGLESYIPLPASANSPFAYESSPVLQRLSAAGTLPLNLNPEVRRSVDMFGALFDTVHAEKSVSEGIRPFFSQLETSLVKLAISDPEFLGSPSHPAHRVLNTMDRISMIAGDDGKITDERLVRLMSRWTDRINAEAEKNPGIFEEARTQLERVVKPLLHERIARIARLQEICEGRQRAELTKSQILAQLLDKLGARVVPNIVIDLINSGWRNVLLMLALRHGENSTEARAAWQAIEQLSEWLDPESTEPPAPTDAQALLQYVDTALTHVCADKFSQDRLLDQLAHALFDQDANLEYTTIAAKLRSPLPETLSAEQDTLLERLRVGDWFQFAALEAPLNLVWVGDKPPVYVFATYRGIKKLDFKRHDLLQALEKNEAQWTEDMELPLMDRSYSAMIQKMQRDLIWQASHDPVTGLANRRAFFRSIRRDWVRNQNPDPDTGYVIGIIQAEVQDASGNPANADTRNAFIREMAQRIQQQLPAGALLARAGEQSIAYWVGMSDTISAKLTSTKLLNSLKRMNLLIDHQDIHVKVYIGLVWVNNGLEPERFYDHANAAATAARESRQEGVVLHHNNDKNRAKPAIALAEWAHELTRILADNRLELNCHAIVDLRDNADPLLIYEIVPYPLADPSAESDQIITHDLFSIAERLLRITEIDRWVLKRLFQWMREHKDQLETLGGFAIKLSGQSVVNPLFLNFLLAELGRGDLPTHKIIFTLSENAAVEGHSQAQHFIRQLQRLGCKFMLDEFGLGTSSYTALKSLKLDYLKIDRSLVRELPSSFIDEAIVRSILETCAFLEIRTVAGFVENEDIQTKLREMGIQYVQGYFINEPVKLESLIY